MNPFKDFKLFPHGHDFPTLIQCTGLKNEDAMDHVLMSIRMKIFDSNNHPENEKLSESIEAVWPSLTEEELRMLLHLSFQKLLEIAKVLSTDEHEANEKDEKAKEGLELCLKLSTLQEEFTEIKAEAEAAMKNKETPEEKKKSLMIRVITEGVPKLREMEKIKSKIESLAKDFDWDLGK